MGVRENYQKGEFGEISFEKQLNRALPHNYERQQAHGNVRPDFAIYDNNGDRQAFVEVKAGEKAGARDIAQAVDEVKAALTETARQQTFFVTKKGFFSQAEKQSIVEASGHDKGAIFVETDRPNNAVKTIVSELESNPSLSDRRGSASAPAVSNFKPTADPRAVAGGGEAPSVPQPVNPGAPPMAPTFGSAPTSGLNHGPAGAPAPPAPTFGPASGTTTSSTPTAPGPGPSPPPGFGGPTKMR